MTFPTDETIAAITTAVSTGQGGVAIVRISGPLAEKVGKSITHIPGKQTWATHHILYGYVINHDTKQTIDEVLILIMKAPRSFTGEDVIEIQCHGGLITVQRVLQEVLNHPEVRLALPGEFSQRAVINGRLDLTQAEAINDLISARSQKAAQLAIAGISGEITQKISLLREQLLDQLCEIEARVDFEEDLPPLNEKKLINNLEEIKKELEKLISDSKKGSLIHKGLKISLIGVPNVGKSSVLNRLTKKEKAIVTDLPGTTRDLLESEIILEGVPITIIDTAGIRTSNDPIEKIGISRSKQAWMNSDVILFIFDLSRGWTKDDQNLLDQLPTKTPKILVGNKSDLQIQSSKVKPEVTLSALTGEGEEKLVESLLKSHNGIEMNAIEVALNERQVELAQAAVNALKKIKEVADSKLPWDFWTIDLREAILKLSELTGEEITEALLDQIFSRFCIGK